MRKQRQHRVSTQELVGKAARNGPLTAGQPRAGARITPATPLLVAIVGRSGAGKSWLADQLKARLGPIATRLSLDDFYRDRSHLTPARRARINYDHPRAIDWASAQRVLRDCFAGRPARVPRYDFKRHARRAQARVFRPKPIILIDGLWWLRRPGLRRFFALTIFIDCKSSLCLRRRVARDLLARGRDTSSVRRQFRNTVEPMSRRYVAPQARWAHLRLQAPVSQLQVAELERKLRERLQHEVPKTKDFRRNTH